MNNVNPVFAATLAAFSGQSHYKRPNVILVPVESFEVEVMTHAADRNGPAEHTWVTPIDSQLREAALHLIAKHADELGDLVEKLVRGEKLA